jgi:DNA-binding FrmR family transcriptional regulator
MTGNVPDRFKLFVDHLFLLLLYLYQVWGQFTFITTMMVTTRSSMTDVILRLKRVGGQVEGLIRMIEREEDCSQIITQFQAAKAALDNTFSLVLQRNLKECMSHDDSKSVEKILKLITKH